MTYSSGDGDCEPSLIILLGSGIDRDGRPTRTSYLEITVEPTTEWLEEEEPAAILRAQVAHLRGEYRVSAVARFEVDRVDPPVVGGPARVIGHMTIERTGGPDAPGDWDLFVALDLPYSRVHVCR